MTDTSDPNLYRLASECRRLVVCANSICEGAGDLEVTWYHEPVSSAVRVELPSRDSIFS